MAKESAAEKAARLAREKEAAAAGGDNPPAGDDAQAGDNTGDQGGDGDGAGDEPKNPDDSDDLQDQGVDTTNLPPAPPPPAAATPAADQPLRVPRPNQGTINEQSVDALLAACERFGIDPRADLPQYQPGRSRGTGPWRQLAAWAFYPGDERGGIPDAVVVVTEGGLKLKHFMDPSYPMDSDTEDRLRKLFRAFEQDPKTREVREVALPDDLALPAEQLDGMVRATDHQYRGGYLKSGGATAAAKRKRPEVVGI